MTQLSTADTTAFFPGSFRPFTRGHADIVERALAMFGRVVIGIGVNSSKTSPADKEAVVEPVRTLYAGNPRVEVMAFDGLTAEEARRIGAACIVRGVRSVKDFEYERDMADVNRRLTGIDTVILFSSTEYGAISSSIVRELQAFGADTTQFLP